MSASNQEMIRENNRRLVLEYIANNPPVSRADLSKYLNLTKATISNIVQELLEEKLVAEIGSAQTALGRKPILLEFQKQNAKSLSIDVRPHRIITLISDLKGENCVVKEYPFSPQDNLFQILNPILEENIQKYADSDYGIIGVSIGIYGVVQNNRVIFTPYYPRPCENLCELLEEKFHLPVILENESNLAVLGESAFHHNYRNMIYVNVHDGIGMGILIDGQLYKGHDGYAGEFGHTILFPDGKPCPCGNHGCFELYASEKAILEEYAERTQKSNVTPDEFLHDYQRKEPAALEIMELFVKYMSIGINNIINTFNTDLIVLNSFFSNCIPDISSRINEYLAKHQKRNVEIIPSKLQDISALMGGIRLSSEHFLRIQNLQISTSHSDVSM